MVIAMIKYIIVKGKESNDGFALNELSLFRLFKGTSEFYKQTNCFNDICQYK
jgi:hypothetical protein